MSRPTIAELFAVLTFLAVTGSCGGSTTPASPTAAPTPGVLQVGGAYRIDQRAVTDSCGQTGTPASVTATVTHAAGGSQFTMADSGGTTFTGSVEQNGTFTANAVFGPDAGGQTYTQRLQGRFTASGFTADLAGSRLPKNQLLMPVAGSRPKKSPRRTTRPGLWFDANRNLTLRIDPLRVQKNMRLRGQEN